MTTVTFLDALLLVLAGFSAGAINALAGGGTFIVFGALTLVGLPAITANATSSIAQFPGYATSAVAYLHELREIGLRVVPYALASIFGGLLGAFGLLAIDNDAFRAVVPWLLIGATTLFAAGPSLTKCLQRREFSAPPMIGWLVQFLVAIYGGFFGGGMGIMMLASLGLTENTSDFHRLNALKTILSTVTAFVTLIVFSSGGAVAWPQATIMLIAVGIGGYGGVHAARRIPQPLIRAFVVAIGTLLTAYYLFTG